MIWSRYFLRTSFSVKKLDKGFSLSWDTAENDPQTSHSKTSTTDKQVDCIILKDKYFYRPANN